MCKCSAFVRVSAAHACLVPVLFLSLLLSFETGSLGVALATLELVMVGFELRCLPTSALQCWQVTTAAREPVLLSAGPTHTFFSRRVSKDFGNVYTLSYKTVGANF